VTSIPLAGIPGAVVVDGFILVPAGLGPRVLAFLLDWLVLTVLYQIMLIVSGIPQPDTEASTRLMFRMLEVLGSGSMPAGLERELDALNEQMELMWSLRISICAAYFTLFHGLLGTTLGKSALGLRVLRSDGSPLGLGKALARYVGYYLAMFIAYTAWLIPFDSKRRTLYDIALGTNVFKVLPSQREP
jgi:uncharacterized RDD family membrane protein YckC